MSMLDSPSRSPNNSFLNRYVQNLEDEKESPLKSLSLSRINSTLKPPSTPTRIDELKFNIVRNSPVHNSNKATNNIFNQSTSILPLNASIIGIQMPNIDTSSMNNEELKYYEFLCRVGEIRLWIEEVIGESIPSEIDLCTGDSLRNGVYLATVAQNINSELVKEIYPAGNKLQFKHTQNINSFFSLVEHVGVPDSFRFELQDLYNKKDMPQVFETLNILITIINKKWPKDTPQLQNLSGQLTFSKEDIRKCQRSWPRIRDFKSLATSPASSPKKNTPIKPALIEDFQIYDLKKKVITEVLKTPERKSAIKSKSEYIPTISNLTTTAQPTDIYQDSTPDAAMYTPSFRIRDSSLLSRTPHLEYSPIKVSSLSYHSPSISRFSARDTDFYLRRSQYREKELQFYDTHSYSPSRYSPRRKQKISELEFLEKTINIQSICRGVNLRFSLNMKLRLARLYEREVLLLQSLIRGNVSTNEFIKNNGVEFQKCELEQLPKLQAVIKAISIRDIFDNLRNKQLRQERFIIQLQTFSRGVIQRRRTDLNWNLIQIINQPLINLQAILIGTLIRINVAAKKKSASSNRLQMITLQSLCRGFNTRRCMSTVLDNFNSTDIDGLNEIQVILKGIKTRNKFRTLQMRLQNYDIEIIQISALLRGKNVRIRYPKNISTDINEQDNIRSLQSYIRGVLVRYALDLVDDIVKSNYLKKIQANARGSMIRSKLNQRNSYMMKNLRSVIKIQNWIRMYNQRSAYLEISRSSSPSLWSVRKFVHLLNGIDNIEELQNQLERQQAALDSENMKKEKLEKELRQQMDLSDVLGKFNIQHEIGSHLAKLSIPKSKYPSFEKLFYLLQVDPAYWKILYTKEPEFTEANVYFSFSTVNQKMRSREKVYFIRFIAETIQLNMVEHHSITEFLDNDSQFWQRMFKIFLQREYPELISLFLPVLEYLNDPRIDFTNDPYIIYKTIHMSEPQHYSTAIKDPETEAKFIENLRNIWHAVELVADVFTNSNDKLPIELKMLCSKVFSFSADRNSKETSSIRAISKTIIGTFSKEYFGNRHYYGFIDSNTESVDLKMSTLMSVLDTLFNFKEFDGYCQPLNQYAEEITPFLKDMLYNMMAGIDYEQDCNDLIYEDMISVRPKLEILSEKILMITRNFQEYSSCFPKEDVIVDILSQCVEDKSLPLAGRVTLELNATSYVFLASDNRMRKVYDQVKRALIYMMQVEEVDTSLYDLAISNLIPNDEPTFLELLTRNPKIASDPMVKCLETPEYFNLKNHALKRISELQNLGVINSSDNKLQNILNDIANTIKNPHYTINFINNELHVTKDTLNEISEINNQLSINYKILKKFLDHILLNFRASKDFSAINKGALGNIKGAYKKVQSKNKPELMGLKFKWTIRQLYEKGVITKIEGEKLSLQTVKVFGSSGPKFPDINFKISTSDGAKFGIQMIDKRKGPANRYGDSVDAFDFYELLNTQGGNNIDTWYQFNSKVTVSTTQLLDLIVTTFYNRHN